MKKTHAKDRLRQKRRMRKRLRVMQKKKADRKKTNRWWNLYIGSLRPMS